MGLTNSTLLTPPSQAFPHFGFASRFFLRAVSSDTRFFHAFAIVLITQPLHTFFVDSHGQGAPIGMTLLVIWEIAAGFGYWWLARGNPPDFSK
jgi:hypothetical protein